MELGIALYPQKTTKQKAVKYIEQANQYGFKHLFFDLLGEAATDKKVLQDMQAIFAYAKQLGWKIVADVNPQVFKRLGFDFDTPQAVAFFSKLNVTGLRLDEDFGGQREAAFTKMKGNPLTITVNASGFVQMPKRLKENGADFSKVNACHNFYPQKYTALGTARFLQASQEAKDAGLKVAAFLALDPSKPSIGPWDVNDGLPTVEFLRDKDLGYQPRFYAATGLIDLVLLGQMFATEDEMQEIAKNAVDGITLPIQVVADLSQEERTIAFEYTDHVIRGDYSDYVIRSSQTRIIYKDLALPAKKNSQKNYQRGDVVIVNEKYGRYKGELHVVLKEMPNDGLKNIVGKVKGEDLELLNFIAPWKKFRLVAKNK